MVPAVQHHQTQNLLSGAAGLWIAVILLLAGTFSLSLLFAALPFFVAALVLRISDYTRSAKPILWATFLFGSITLIGFLALISNWGRLDYGLSGYVLLFAPFLSLFTTFALGLVYLCARKKHSKQHRA